MRNLVASSIRRWRLPLAPNLASADGASEQIVATCYDAESRVTYAVTDACNLYGVRDSAREGDDAELCLEMCLVESVPSATDAFDTPGEAQTERARVALELTEKNQTDQTERDAAVLDEAQPSAQPSEPSHPPDPPSEVPSSPSPLRDDVADDAADATEASYQPALRRPSPVVGVAFVDELRGVCVACATGELLLVAPDPDDDDDALMAPGAVLTRDMTPECVGRVAQGLRAMRWNPDGELLVLATWAGTLILMTKEFRVLAEAPVGGGGGDGVASLSWRGDGQFLASLVSARGAEPQLRVWEREDLTFHATGESLRPARISAGDPRGGDAREFSLDGDGEKKSGEAEAEPDSMPHAPPLAWQPRGALVAVACAPQRAREDSDVDSTSASDARDDEASRRRGVKGRAANAASFLPPTEAEIVFFERNGLRRGSFHLPRRGAGVEVTSLAWSCDSERLAVCVTDPEAFSNGGFFDSRTVSRADGATRDGETEQNAFVFGAATQIWRRGNGKWYLAREIRFPTREGTKVHCAWDLTNPNVLRLVTPAGRVEEHVFEDEHVVSSAATSATVDGADVLVTPLARALFPPPMCAATVAFPATVADVCFCPASAIRPSLRTNETPNAARSSSATKTARRFVPRGEAVLALLSDGRLAIASARRATEWEETVEDVADEDDELEYAKEASHLHHGVGGGDDGGACVKLEAVVVSPAGGTFSVLEREDDVPRRVAWLDAETALVAADRPSDGSASLLTVRLSFAYPRDSPRVARGSREPRWSCEIVSAVDLPAPANAVARAEGESPPGAFVQMQEHGDLGSSVSLFASVVTDEHGDPVLAAIPASWPSASLPHACVALAAAPPSLRGAPPTLAGLDARGVLRCGSRVVARDVRSFAVHVGNIGSTDELGFEEDDAALASARAYAETWRAWSSSKTETTSPVPPEARLVYATLADELRVVDLADVFVNTDDTDVMDDTGSDPTDGGRVSDDARTFETGNAFATAAGGTRANAAETRRVRAEKNENRSVQNDRMHVSMRAAMRPADAGRGIDSRTRRIEQGARVVAAPPGTVDVVLQMPRGNLEKVAPRALVLPFLARALDARRFAIAAAVAARHRVDLNVIVDRAWPRFLKHADAFVRDVDDPDVVAEILECLDGGDCTAPGAPYARLPTPAPEAEDAALLERANVENINDEEDPVAVGSNRGLLTGPSLDLARLARAMMTHGASSGASFGAEGPPGASRRTPRNDPDDGSVSAADEAAAEARRADPRGKIRLTCSAIARAVARVAAEKDAARRMRREDGEKTREDGGVVPSSADETTPTSTRESAYSVVEPPEELEAPEPPVFANTGTVDAAKSPPVAVSVARFEGMSVASVAEEADSAESARDGVRRSRPGDGDDGDASPRASPVSVSGFPTNVPTNASLDERVDVNDENETTIDHEESRRRVDAVDTDALLPDRWELVMLSAHARSCPPDLEGALRRVRRRREAEIAVSGLEKNTRLASAIDRLGHRLDDLEDVDSDVALDHLLALEGGKPLFDAAMGTYDLSAAYLVGARAPGMDPGEYVPELERLQAMPEPLRNADIDLRLGRWRSAVENLLKGGDATQACALAAKKRLFPHALAVAAAWEREHSQDAARTEDALSEEPREPRDPRGVGRGRRVGASGGAAGPKPVSALRATVAAAYAGQLGEERRHEDAAVVLLSVGDVRGAMRAYADGSAWRPALALAGRLALPAPERRALASELADTLEQFDPAAAAAVAERELGDVDRAASLLCAARKWRDVASVAYANGRGDLVETVVAPAAAEAASGVASAAREAPARAEKYLERLRKLRQRREALEKALGDEKGGDGADAALGTSGGAFGRPGTQRERDDDGASEISVASTVSVSTLASGVSGFSAYTDRTLGAGTVATDASSKTSLSASTVGGRRAKKPTRAERRGKKAGAGLRAGGPTEERDLAIHLASGGVASELLAVGALEHVGELSELLVVLGHADDAAKLQGAVAAAMAAHEAASAEARRALDALDAAEAKRNTGGVAGVAFEERDGDRKTDRKSGPYAVACPCSACVAHRSVHCLAAKNAQWKWAALRDAPGPVPKKKAPTIWDDVAETAREAF